MKVRKFLAGFAGISLLLGFAPGQAGAATAGAVKVVLTGDCADGEHVEGQDEDDCAILVSVNPKSKNVSARVEVAYDEDEPEWEEYISGKTRGGRVKFEISAYDEEDMWADGVALYRVVITKKPSGLKAPKPREYRVQYVSELALENDPELEAELDKEAEEDKEFNQQMDSAQAENTQHIQQQQPNANISQGRPSGPPKFDKAAEFNRACGAIGFAKSGCDQLVAVKTPAEALAILGDKAEAWCNALAAPMGRTVPCAMVLPNVFPPF